MALGYKVALLGVWWKRGEVDTRFFSSKAEQKTYFDNLISAWSSLMNFNINDNILMKDEEIYNIFNTGKLLNRPARVAIDVHSGLAGIALWLNTRLAENHHDLWIEKQSPIVAAMKEQVDAQYAAGRNTSMGDEELLTMLQEIAPDVWEKAKD